MALLAVTLISSAHAQTAIKDNKLEQEIRKIDQANTAAVLTKDVAALEKLWADDLKVNAPNNKILTGKKNALQLVKGGILDYSSFETAIEAVLIDGNTAIVMGEETVKPQGKAPFAGQTLRRRFTNIWIMREGKWQITARQATIISKE